MLLQTYIVYMGDLPKTKTDFSVAAVHSNMLQQVIGRLIILIFSICDGFKAPSMATLSFKDFIINFLYN